MGNGITGYIYAQSLEASPCFYVYKLHLNKCFKKHCDKHTIKCLNIIISFSSTDFVNIK